MKTTQIPTLRKLLLSLSFIVLPVSGFLWAVDVQDYHAPGVIILFVLAVLTAFGSEIFAALQERRTTELESQLTQTRIALEQVRSSGDRKVQELDRLVDTLSEHNADLRAQLLHEKSVQGDRLSA